MARPRDEQRMRVIMRLLYGGVTSPTTLAAHVGIKVGAMKVWLAKNDLRAAERAAIAAEGKAERATRVGRSAGE